MRHGRSLTALVVAGLLVALVLAVFVAPHGSASPDGVQKVAAEQHLGTGATASTGPFGDDGSIGTGVAAAIGVVATFGATLALSKLVKTSRSRRTAGRSTT